MKRQPILACLLAALLVPSAPAWSMDLWQLYQEARTQDPTLAAAQAARAAGQEKTQQAQALYTPKLDVSGQGVLQSNHTNFKSPVPDVSRNGVLLSSAVTANYNLWDARRDASASQLQQQAQLSEQTLVLAEQSFMIRVAQAYFDVLDAEDNLREVEAEKRATENLLAQAKKSFEVGVTPITDTHEAQTRHDLTEARVVAAQNRLATKRSALSLLLGREVSDKLQPLAESDLALGAAQPLAAWLELAHARNPQIKIKQLQWSLAQLEAQKQRAGEQPSVGLFAKVGASVDPNGVQGSGVRNVGWQAQLGVAVNWSVSSGGLVPAQTREAEALTRQASMELEASKREVEQALRAAYLDTQNGRAQLQALDQAMRSARLQLDSTKLGKEVGVRTTLDVLNAEQQLHSAVYQREQARYQLLVSQLRLLVAAGALQEEALQKLNAMLGEKTPLPLGSEQKSPPPTAVPAASKSGKKAPS